MSNLTIREQNMLLCFGDDEDAQAEYLRGAQSDEPKAFKMALERMNVNQLFNALKPGIKEIYDHGINEYGALDFIRERHYRMHFPKN